MCNKVGGIRCSSQGAAGEEEMNASSRLQSCSCVQEGEIQGWDRSSLACRVGGRMSAFVGRGDPLCLCGYTGYASDDIPQKIGDPGLRFTSWGFVDDQPFNERSPD